MYGNSEIGDAGLAALAGALPPTLRKLDIERCGCGDEGMAAIAAALPSTQLDRLDVRAIPFVLTSGWAALGAAATEMSQLQTLVAEDCSGMGDTGAEALAAGLPESVTELYLDDCGIRSDGAQALAAALPRWPNLVRLGASDNPMGEAGEAGLRAAAATHQGRVYLRDDDFSDDE